MSQHKRRIYFGPDGAETSIYWTVAVSNAKRPVTINGSVAHALAGASGHTLGCALSNVAIDQANRNAFPHPAYFVAITKSTAFVVDKLDKSGQPCHAVRYEHNYGNITDANDKRTLKRLVKQHPEIMARSFTLKVPRTQRWNRAWTNPVEQNRGSGPKPRGTVHASRGALARAVKAGRISKPAATQLANVASARAA